MGETRTIHLNSLVLNVLTANYLRLRFLDICLSSKYFSWATANDINTVNDVMNTISTKQGWQACSQPGDAKRLCWWMEVLQNAETKVNEKKLGYSDLFTCLSCTKLELREGADGIHLSIEKAQYPKRWTLIEENRAMHFAERETYSV